HAPGLGQQLKGGLGLIAGKLLPDPAAVDLQPSLDEIGLAGDGRRSGRQDVQRSLELAVVAKRLDPLIMDVREISPKRRVARVDGQALAQQLNRLGVASLRTKFD